jgi:TonB family protein
MKLTREELYGLGGSALLCLLLLLLLAWAYLRTEVPGEMTGIPVDFGTAEWAAGPTEPASSPSPVTETAPVPEVRPTPAPPASQQPVITQNEEETAAVVAERKRREEERRREAERREAERKRQEEERQRQAAIHQEMSAAFGAGSATAGSQGAAPAGAGNQGRPDGEPAGRPAGDGGMGSFDLSGRSLRDGSLQRPSYDIQEEGTIVVSITVDPQGNVVHAEIRLRGTTIEHAGMRRSAVAAAQKTHFNRIDGAQNQIGTITYKYSLR